MLHALQIVDVQEAGVVELITELLDEAEVCITDSDEQNIHLNACILHVFQELQCFALIVVLTISEEVDDCREAGCRFLLECLAAKPSLLVEAHGVQVFCDHWRIVSAAPELDFRVAQDVLLDVVSVVGCGGVDIDVRDAVAALEGEHIYFRVVIEQDADRKNALECFLHLTAGEQSASRAADVEVHQDLSLDIWDFALLDDEFCALGFFFEVELRHGIGAWLGCVVFVSGRCSSSAKEVCL